jgi:hypothetical protein
MFYVSKCGSATCLSMQLFKCDMLLVILTNLFNVAEFYKCTSDTSI